VRDDAKAKQPTLGKWLAQDARRAPAAYARRVDVDLGVEDIPVARYTSRAFHEQEMELMWPRAWQVACHESEIPEPGDYTTYEIGVRSFIVVRLAEDLVKAFPNACLHRAMQLVDGPGHGAAFSCRFHGWAWNIDGTLRRIPEAWDFPQTKTRNMCLPEAKVARWGGFVFINPDPNAARFEDYIGDLSEHFSSAPLEDRRVAYHVARILPANWKVAMEAFMESYHVSPTHPQSMAVSEYAETQYDIYNDNVSRLATISVAPASPLAQKMSAQEFADYAAKTTGREPVKLTKGQTYRNALAEERRKQVAAVTGRDTAHLTDCEMLDAVEYFVFPNFMPWHGFGLPIAYRFRPHGDRHDSSIMEVYLFAPRAQNEPASRAPPLKWLAENAPFADDPGLGRLGAIFDQDYDNITGVWRGLHSTAQSGVVLGRYQESRIRHYHNRIDQFLSSSEGSATS
jgi:phenylpropionate dioxygenase-like ring-hydroxylating dioxygenase large terminal subunit